MRLDHEFTVPAPPAEVWKAVTDPERVAPCMPGATLTKVEGETFTGTVKVKLGPISLLYKGSGEFLETDEQARKIVIKASGKDSRGAGTAAATVTVTLSEENGGTKGTVATDLNVTGRPAQFGRGMISEVGGKILDQFATNLADRLGSAETPSAPATEDKPAESGVTTEPAPEKPKLETVKPQAQEAEAIDLFEYAGSSITKRLAPVLAGLAAVLGVVAIVRLLRRR
ncbi:SRPBCC family protein [Amycolatopsis thermophila]|uniref:Carbon monoxide dehydrogenase subunit G n=1 Tax=Amycolatopsis thermophila TaxID=206084 RepID=A0ABU0EWG4_9PSEU|nr:SRPBCC family protein [Amycolatopsis thermophila]MDQ0379650.1 carbon monoxide dehydrogenase subunit G [Amycolatopsis thermophila]